MRYNVPKQYAKLKESCMKPHHICIQTNCYQQSLAFYTQALGFDVMEETPNFHGRDYNTWLCLGDFMIELQTGKGGESLPPYEKNRCGIVHFCLYSDDMDADYERIKAIDSIQFLPKQGSDIYTVCGGRLFKVQAPEGTIIEVRDTL